jgi:hypothetical protein
MVDMKKYTSILTFRMQHSTRSVYLELTQLFIFSQLKVLFIPDKEYISVNTKSKNTEKQQCVHFGVRDTPHPQIYFSWENVNFPVDQTNLITVDSKRTEQNFFLIRLSQMFEPEQLAIKCRCLF